MDGGSGSVVSSPLAGLTRRAIGGAAAGLLALGPSLATATDREDAIPVGPVAQLHGFMRLFAGQQGSCVFTNQGIIYGRAPDELPRPLVGYVAVLQIRPQEVARDIFRTAQIEALAFLDLTTGEPLTTWRNPYTEEVVIPVGYASPENIYYFDVTGSYTRALPLERTGRFHLDWHTSDTDIWVTETRRNAFPSGITEEEFPRAYAGPVRHSVDILTYRARISDFVRETILSVPSQLAMLSDTPWPLWMMMGRRPGQVLWHGFGAKYARLSDVPLRARRVIEAAYPGFLEDPWAFDVGSWGTAAQLRRLKAGGRIR